jgi:hypothetical protein
LFVPLCNILTACLTFGYVPIAWQKARTGKIIQTHQFDIFSLENDGKASRSSYKGGTIKGLSFKTQCSTDTWKANRLRPHYMILFTRLMGHWLRKNLPWTSSSMSREVSTTYFLNRWMTRRVIRIMVFVLL